MTASDEPGVSDPHGRTAGDRALDLLVFAPAGAVLTAVEDLPEMAAKGRERLGQQVRNAQVVGRFAVDIGWRQLQQQLQWLVGARQHGAETTPTPSPQTPGPLPGRRVAPDRTAPDASAPRRPEPAPRQVRPVDRDPAVDRAIPDYDSLSASQVVRRLDGLGADELRAVVRHELAGRGRRTVVHRAEQLLGTGGLPPAGTPAT